MYVGRDFDPSDTEESEPYAFDFAPDLLEAGEVINSVEFNVAIARSSQAEDPDPASRMQGVPMITGTIVAQRFANFVQRARYFIRAKVVTSAGNTRSLHSFVNVQEQR